jgi:hypothetical protein
MSRDKTGQKQPEIPTNSLIRAQKGPKPRTAGSFEPPDRPGRHRAGCAEPRSFGARRLGSQWGLELAHIPVESAPDEDVEVLRRGKHLPAVPDLQLQRDQSFALEEPELLVR